MLFFSSAASVFAQPCWFAHSPQKKRRQAFTLHERNKEIVDDFKSLMGYKWSGGFFQNKSLPSTKDFLELMLLFLFVVFMFLGSLFFVCLHFDFSDFMHSRCAIVFPCFWPCLLVCFWVHIGWRLPWEVISVLADRSRGVWFAELN